MKLILEELGVASEVEELADKIMEEFKTVYDSGKHREIIPRGVVSNNSPIEQLTYLDNNGYFDGAIASVKIKCLIFATLEDYYNYKQKYTEETFPFYNYEERLVFIPIYCTKDEITFDKVKTDIWHVVEHELLHAYQSSKMKGSVGNDLYYRAVEGMSKFKKETLENLVCQIVYFSSLFEIDAQAHNYIRNLKQENPSDYNEAREIKPYPWIDTIKHMVSDAIELKNHKKLKEGLNYLGLDWKQFEIMFKYGIKYRQKKFDKVLSLFFNRKKWLEKNLTNGGNGPDEMRKMREQNDRILDEQINYLIENIF